MKIPNKKAMNSLRTKTEAYQAGYNAGIEDRAVRLKRQEPKWFDLGGRINLSGVKYSDYQLVFNSLPAGTVVSLIGEPSCVHDTKAIRVEHDGIKLGYIPKGSWQQAKLWIAHTEGRKCVGIVTAFNKTNPTWSMITIQLRVKTLLTDNIVPKDIKF